MTVVLTYGSHKIYSGEVGHVELKPINEENWISLITTVILIC